MYSAVPLTGATNCKCTCGPSLPVTVSVMTKEVQFTGECGRGPAFVDQKSMDSNISLLWTIIVYTCNHKESIA